jgi:hypothetical protein
MKKIICAIMLGFCITACTKTAPEEIIPNGKYTGTFERLNGAADKQTSNVTITFTGNNFTGESDKAMFPAICNGSYSGKGSDIHFTNRCVWIAAFDWTLILANDYSLRASGDSLEIKREYQGQITDVYRLKKDQE